MATVLANAHSINHVMSPEDLEAHARERAEIHATAPQYEDSFALGVVLSRYDDLYRRYLALADEARKLRALSIPFLASEDEEGGLS